MQVYDEANVLAAAIRDSDLCREYRQLRQETENDETGMALLREYKKLQMRLQMAAVAGAETEESETRRFQQIGSLLFSQPVYSQYLLCEMRVQQMMADVCRILSDAAGLDIPGFPG